MATTTPKGYRYPVPNDPNNVPQDIQRLAEDVDRAPGIQVYTTAERDALLAAARWVDRLIWNTTVDRLERWDGAAWVPVLASRSMRIGHDLYKNARGELPPSQGMYVPGHVFSFESGQTVRVRGCTSTLLHGTVVFSVFLARVGQNAVALGTGLTANATSFGTTFTFTDPPLVASGDHLRLSIGTVTPSSDGFINGFEVTAHADYTTA